MTGFRLAHLILHALEMNIIEWAPVDVSGCCDHILLNKDQWMQFFYNYKELPILQVQEVPRVGHENILGPL